MNAAKASPTIGEAKPLSIEDLTPDEAKAISKAFGSALDVEIEATAPEAAEASGAPKAPGTTEPPVDHPDGTGTYQDVWRAEIAKSRAINSARNENVNWRDLVDEAVTQVFAQKTPEALMGKLEALSEILEQWRAAVEARNPKPIGEGEAP